MGHKVHPIGFRLGILYGWQSKWYADKNYTELLHEDLGIRTKILKRLSDAAVSRVDLERNANLITFIKVGIQCFADVSLACQAFEAASAQPPSCCHHAQH